MLLLLSPPLLPRLSREQVWFSMRQEAKAAAEKEPLLVSFVYSTILNQKTLEAAVAFHLANKVRWYFGSFPLAPPLPPRPFLFVCHVCPWFWLVVPCMIIPYLYL